VGANCDGCEAGWDETPEWPCRTVKLIAEYVAPDMVSTVWAEDGHVIERTPRRDGGTFDGARYVDPSQPVGGFPNPADVGQLVEAPDGTRWVAVGPESWVTTEGSSDV
jgi:hypothetical protein